MDRLIWHFEKSGIYKVRTGYKLMAKAGRGEGGGIVAHLAPWWSAVLKLNMVPKVRIFLTSIYFIMCYPQEKI